jgi:predicted nucleic acid-binding protein
VIVLDASAIVEILLDSPKAPKARALYYSEQSHAPELVSFEVLSAITGKVRRRELAPDAGLNLMLDFEGIEENLELWPLLDLMTEKSIAMGENVTAYDVSYVAPAQIMACPLVTADGRLGRAVGSLIDVIVI